MDRRQLLGAMAWWPGIAAPGARAATNPIRIVMTPGQPQAWVTLQIVQALYQSVDQPMLVNIVPLARASKEMNAGQADAELIRVAPYFADNPMVVKVEPRTQ